MERRKKMTVKEVRQRQTRMATTISYYLRQSLAPSSLSCLIVEYYHRSFISHIILNLINYIVNFIIAIIAFIINRSFYCIINHNNNDNNNNNNNKMCLIETYLQMAQIDAQIKQQNGSVEAILDLSNKDEKSQKEIQTITDRMEKQNLNDHNDDNVENSNKTPTESSSNESFVQLFKMFAKFGDCKSTGETITLSNSDKWFKQAKIIDPSNRTITTTDTGIYFKQVSK